MKKQLLIVLFVTLYGLSYGQFVSLDNDRDQQPSSERIIIESTPNYIVIQYKVNGFYLKENIKYGADFKILTLDGFGNLSEFGKPQLPARTDFIAIPEDANISVSIIDAEYVYYESVLVIPAQKPHRDSYSNKNLDFIVDKSIYEADIYYPESNVKLLEIQKYKSQPIGLFQLVPIQFNPVQKKLRICKSITYRIDFAGKLFKSNHPKASKEIRKLVLNSNQIKEQKQSDIDKLYYNDYLIITTPDYEEAAVKLAEWKRQTGLHTEIILKDDWSEIKVRDAIHLRFDNWTIKPSYFVIIGDHEDVPGMLKYEPEGDSIFATDLYYACVDGGSDYFPDLAHGRISVTNAEEALTVIDKIIDYEQNPVATPSFYQTGINCAQFQDEEPRDTYSDRRFVLTCEDIRNYLQDKNYAIQRIYAAYENVNPKYWNNDLYADGSEIPIELQRPNFNWTGSAMDIFNGINEGCFYILHRDHGLTSGEGWHTPYFTNMHINSLSNGNKLPVVFSVNCHTGEFYNKTSFAETFLRKNDGGAVGVIAASYYSFSGYNDAFLLGMFDAIWPEPGINAVFGTGGIDKQGGENDTDVYAMGDVLNYGLISINQTWNNSTGMAKYTSEIYHYFGDPAMKIYTTVPLNIIAEITSVPDCSSSTLFIKNCNAENAIVTLVHENKIIAKSEINSGQCLLEFNPVGNSSEDIILTISKHNYRPYIQSFAISGDCENGTIADFTSNRTIIYAGDEINFYDNSSFAPYYWEWQFQGGEPAFSSEKNPENILYSTPGKYSVELRVQNQFGEASIHKVDYVEVLPAIITYSEAKDTTLTGDGIFYDSGGKYGNYSSDEVYSVTFLPDTCGKMASLIFKDFDIQNSEDCDKDRMVIYNGTDKDSPLLEIMCRDEFLDTIIASNPDGALTVFFQSDKTINKTGWIAEFKSVSVQPVANFLLPSDVVCKNDTIEFESHCLGRILDYEWNFGTGAIPNVAFGPGPHKIRYNSLGEKFISLTILGNDSVSRRTKKSIFVKEKMAAPEVISQDTICENDEIALFISDTYSTVWFTDLDLNYMLAMGKYFRPQNIEAGYHEFYAVTSNAGCYSDPTICTLYVKEQPLPPEVSNDSLCETPFSYVLFAEGENLNWYSDITLDTLINIGDRLRIDNIEFKDYKYYVTQTINGCTSEIDTAILSVHYNPIAGFSHANNGLFVSFNSTKSDGDLYRWDFGDGNVIYSYNPNPSYLYANSGEYLITQMVFNANCSDYFKDTIEVTELDINRRALRQFITVQPNPNNGNFTVKLDFMTSEDLNLKIFSAYGQLIQKMDIEKQKHEISQEIKILGLTEGVYFLNFSTSNEHFGKKVIVRNL